MPQIEQVDVNAVRALAHPLRLRLLDLLRFDGPSTATLLARRVGESSGSTSYHLRQLDRHGFIEEAPRRGGRERWWRYRERKVAIADINRDQDDSRNVLAELLTREAHALDRFLAQAGPNPALEEAAFFQSRALRMTAPELQELGRTIEAVLARLRRADSDEAPPGASPVRFLAFGFPLSNEDG